jgi:hypothetical protein
MKHTPGPWFLERITENAFHILDGDGEQSGLLAVVEDSGNGETPVKANAHLIATAPEMLEALERIEGLLLQSTGMAGIEIHSIVRRARLVASEAIAKARGES